MPAVSRLRKYRCRYIRFLPTPRCSRSSRRATNGRPDVFNALLSTNVNHPRLAFFAVASDIALHEPADDADVRQQMLCYRGGGDCRWALGEGQRQDELIGAVRVDGCRGGVEVGL